MKVLLTGGAGFIGSHTCVALLEIGYEVIILDSFITSSYNLISKLKKLLKKNLIKRLSIVEGDIRNQTLLEKLFFEAKKTENPISSVIHFAGLKSVNESIDNPLSYWDSNVIGSIELFKIMAKYDCKTIVFSSSASIYGNNDNKHLDESSHIKPINPYGKTKVAIEEILNDLFNSSRQKWKIANLRYFNPIGAHPSGIIGESPIKVSNNIFPLLIKVASGEKKYINIYGNDWPTYDGTGVRDYIHVMDLAKGHIAALNHLENNSSKIININLGTGIGTSVLELIKQFEEANNVKIPFKFVSKRKGDVASVIADNSFALKCLNWQPKKSIREMCIDGWKWKLSNPNF